jgi:hypothetical protein
MSDDTATAIGDGLGLLLLGLLVQVAVAGHVGGHLCGVDGGRHEDDVEVGAPTTGLAEQDHEDITVDGTTEGDNDRRMRKILFF